MPIQIPDLYDRNYAQLLKETEGVIGRYFPEYSEIGPSDPAVALNELFCYLFDVTMYQLNRITPETRNNFAALLGVPPEPGNYQRTPEEALRLALAKLTRVDRAITAGDIEVLLMKASADLCTRSVRRVFVHQGASAGGLVRVFVVQEEKSGNERATEEISGNSVKNNCKTERDLQNLYAFLRVCSPIGTRYLIAHAPLLEINVSAEVAKRRDSTISNDRLAGNVREKLSAYIHPLTGGVSGTGWEFGKAITRGDIYGLIEGIPGVDHVRSLYIKESIQAGFSVNDTIFPEKGGLCRFAGEQSVIMVI